MKVVLNTITLTLTYFSYLGVQLNWMICGDSRLGFLINTDNSVVFEKNDLKYFDPIGSHVKTLYCIGSHL